MTPRSFVLSIGFGVKLTIGLPVARVVGVPTPGRVRLTIGQSIRKVRLGPAQFVVSF